MIKLIRWLFWKSFYFFLPQPQNLGVYLERSERTRWPRWKFKPDVWHNEAGKQWEIYLENESHYVEPRTVRAYAHISEYDGRIIGLTILDRELLVEAGEGDLPIESEPTDWELRGG